MRKKKTRHVPHADPAKEMQLEHIRALMRLRAGAEDQIRGYLDEIASAQSDLHYAVRMTGRTYQEAQELCERRTALAEKGIRETREFLLGLQNTIQAEISKNDLNENDLACL